MVDAARNYAMKHVKPPRLPALGRPSYKKWWLLGGAGLTLLILGVGYGILSQRYWSDYEQKNHHHYMSAREKIDTALAMKSSSSADQTKKLDAFEVANDTLDDTTICKVAPLYAWQGSLTKPKALAAECGSKATKVAAFQNRLEAVLHHLRGEAQLVKIISSVAPVDEADESKWVGTLAAWRTVTAQVSSVDTSASVKSTQQVAKEKAEAVTAAWQALIAAHDAKDRAKYETALTDLTAAYGKLGDISSQSESSLNDLLKKLETNYHDAFTEQVSS